MGKNKAAVAHPAAAIDGDGMSPSSYIEASIKSSGLERKVVCNRLGPNSLPKQTENKAMPNAPLTEPMDEQILQDGARLDGKPITPEAAKSAGAFKLLKGEQTVLLGPDQLCAGYADVSCVHTGGGYIAQGSQTVFVGAGQGPSARVDDPTSDGYAVSTGALTVEVG